nr:transmembrane ascorbate-dependent reductase CYB561-like isoform X1 [Procambarus clarkii]XP_045600372.1 transmembrane ascorbate-dependent reductase CYB561-like isoform X1 [Procambarus clarkii]XP_045600373.1 transmembrane ascorbate-dependent reductase CYB561-like isoform X1 [Procambarus clarkii]XP_045600376.1 transmembrane ascorbate-dependent reductase CYB561-like isoform X1 [Procambarus clarkii]XP_045600377.1 transmembrane ascorbate-dependent reductase CYB561-like isoform X1 [Procambarus clar
MSGQGAAMSTFRDTPHTPRDNTACFSSDDDEEDTVEYNACRIKRDWETGEEGSLIGRGTLDEMENEAQHVPFFTKLFTLSQVLGILSVVLVGVWCGYFRKGFAWFSDPDLQFNWHPFLMTLGMVFLYANGALIYRGFRSEKKKKLKILHMMIQLGAFILSIVGLVAVFNFHNARSIPNMYSLHSWIGLITVILFSCQWLVGLLTFLFPGLRPSVRAAYLPLHQFFGLFIFVGAVASCLLGLTEKAIFAVKDYSSLSSEGILINVTGLVLIIFGGLVVYLISQPKFRRQTTEDEVLLTDTVLE